MVANSNREFTKGRGDAHALVRREVSVLQSINFLFFLRVFHAAISVSALISRAEAVISEQENFWPFSVKT